MDITVPLKFAIKFFCDFIKAGMPLKI